MSQQAGDSQQQDRVLDFKGLWWIPLIIFASVAAMLLRIFLPAAREGIELQPSKLAVADYGFQLDDAVIDAGRIVSSGLPRDQIHALSDPPVVMAAEVPEINKRERRLYHRKFIVSGDRVIGVSLNGEERAYQINILNYHEIVNDTLGGVPIVVTYSPLCDSAAVFRRDPGGELLNFASSGLMLESNTMMYDVQPQSSDSSLWSQLMMEAVAGPQAGQRLELIPAALTHWGDWSQRHPESTLMARETGESRDYNSNPYLRYQGLGKLRFPLSVQPPDMEIGLFDRIVAIREGEDWRLYTFDDVETQAGDAGTFEYDGLRFDYIPYSPTMDAPGVVVTDAQGNYQPTVSAFWFAWFATHPDARLSRF